MTAAEKGPSAAFPFARLPAAYNSYASASTWRALCMLRGLSATVTAAKKSGYGPARAAVTRSDATSGQTAAATTSFRCSTLTSEPVSLMPFIRPRKQV